MLSNNTSPTDLSAIENRGWKILLVEDDSDDYLLTRSLLWDAKGQNGLKLEWVTDVDQALKTVQTHSFDVLLVDYALGARTGLEFIRDAVSQGCQAPIILLSGLGNYEIDLEAMQAGAVDYLTKGEITAPLLERTIRYAIERKRTEEELRRYQDVLELRVRERTQELARVNEQLAATNLELERVVGDLRGEITERRRVEDALRESEQRFRTIFEESALGMQLNDLQGRILASNPALQEMLGYSGEELRQLTFAELTCSLDLPVIKHLYQRLASGEQDRFRVENRLMHKDGRLLWGRQSVSLVRDESERPQLVVSILENVSERKQMELELAEVRRKLMDSREAERLYLAQELHDGPMQDLYGVSYQLQSVQPGDEDSAAQLQDLHEDISQIVRVLRVIAGELRPPTLTPFGLQRTILSHVENFQNEHPEIKVHLELTPDGLALPERVRLAFFRVYQQTLANVARHAQARNVWVRFDLGPERALLEIRDDGRGFEVPERWIDFVREGHLGLAGAAERAEAVGGALEVQSAPGQGARLKIWAPRYAQNEENS